MSSHGNLETKRDEEEGRLPDEAIVMRGGLSTPDTLQKTALRHFDIHGEFAISVRSKPA